MANMNRREFLRNVSIASAAGATACTYDPKTPQEKILPYVVQDEAALPGTAMYFATMCTGCANACGMVARSKEGRTVMVEGNPDHPSGGGLCVKGHLDLLATYSPDRFDGPMDAGQSASWDDARTKIATAVKAARDAGKQVAWLGNYRSGSVAQLLGELAADIGLRRVHWEVGGVESLLAAAGAAFSVSAIPTFDLAAAHTIVSFGYDFLGSAPDYMHLAKGWASAKDPAQGGFVARFVAVEPRVSHTSSQADLFLSPTPGTEVRAALALARLVADKRGADAPGAALVAGVDAATEAAAAGIALERLTEVAGWIAEGHSVVLPGGPANAGVDATALATVALLINAIAGNLGSTVHVGREVRFGQVNSFADAKALLADAEAGNVGVLFLDGANPVYNLPADVNAAAALDKIGLVVQLDNETNDSTRPNALVLPVGSGLESWGDAEVVAGVHVLQQPTMTALKNVRGVGDILLALGKDVVGDGVAAAPVAVEATPVAEAAPTDAPPADVAAAPVAAAPAKLGYAAATFREYVQARWQKVVFPLSGDGDFNSFWVSSLQRGGFFAEAARSAPSLTLAAAPSGGAGVPGEGLAVVVYPHPHLGDGRHANRAWAQELPDPIATYTWTTWAELNPKTVAKLGLGEKDLVTVTTASGEITVGYFASPGVREDAVAIPLGNGHEQMGRYGTGRGVNPMKLLASAEDAASKAFAGYTVRAAVKRAVGSSDVHALVGNINQDGRQLANLVAAEDAVAHVEGEAGGLVHLHHPPIDERLTKKGLLDMYPEPEHPTYRFAMAIDTNVCNGCMACVVACNLENNIPFVGPDQVRRGRTMNWIRMDRFWEGEGEHQDVRYLPALCQHCAHAPCEGVCPVLATYHNLDGLNAMIYNRCVGTRYCANNCPYTARRFNYHTWEWPESMHLMLNPDVSVREMGVMEKCTFCVQRTRSVKDSWRDVAFQQRAAADAPVEVALVPDSALVKLTACASACPTGAITFGNAKDEAGSVAKKFASPRSYTLLAELNTKPGIKYLARVRHGGGHGAPGGHASAPASGGHAAAGEAHGAAQEHAPASGHEGNGGHATEPAAGH
jgi:Fe-S-cluster-containing dehydrogenase component/anaerobic selenocysteine-containing dehydrogenase